MCPQILVMVNDDICVPLTTAGVHIHNTVKNGSLNFSSFVQNLNSKKCLRSILALLVNIGVRDTCYSPDSMMVYKWTRKAGFLSLQSL